MTDETVQTIAIALIFCVAGIMIGLAFFKGVHFEPHTWVKIGGAALLIGCGGYFWWARR